jgi:hypothetical protein
MHADFIPAGVTGDTTTTALLEEGPLDDLSFRDRKVLWNSGNIDAPEFICVGGVRAVVIQGTFEGCTPRTRAR